MHFFSLILGFEIIIRSLLISEYSHVLMIDWSFCYVLFVSLRHASSSSLRDYQIKHRGENKGINWLFYKLYIQSAKASGKKIWRILMCLPYFGMPWFRSLWVFFCPRHAFRSIVDVWESKGKWSLNSYKNHPKGKKNISYFIL